MKIDFLIAGVQKGGTTSLAWYLRQHPKIGFPRRVNGRFVKELHFFNRPGDEHDPDYSRYHAQFDFQDGRALHGEATPLYVYWRGALSRIRDYNPAVKLVVLLRNPVERAWSHWKMQRDNGTEDLSFPEALLEEPRRFRRSHPRQNRYGYVDRGRYQRQLEELRALFPAGQICFIKSEDFFRQTAPTLSKITDFLGIGEIGWFEARALGQTAKKELLPAEQRKLLLKIFQDEIAAVERHLGWDCSDWRS